MDRVDDDLRIDSEKVNRQIMEFLGSKLREPGKQDIFIEISGGAAQRSTVIYRSMLSAVIRCGF